MTPFKIYTLDLQPVAAGLFFCDGKK